MASDDTTPHPPFEWLGGRICLDFTNTVTWAGTELLNERLAAYGDLVDWGERAEILSETAGRRLRRAARNDPAGAAEALADAHALRRAIHEVMGARAEVASPSGAPRTC